MTPLLSILICTVPRRREMCAKLFDELARQAEGQPVEILALLDNKKRTIGAKRQALLEAARGEYVAYVDDDDLVAPDYVAEILTAIKAGWPDLITFKVQTTINGGLPGIVSLVHGANFEEYMDGARIRRPPHELCVWNRSIASRAKFADMNVGEDYAWASQLWSLVARAFFIDKILYYYRFRTDLAETEK